MQNYFGNIEMTHREVVSLELRDYCPLLQTPMICYEINASKLTKYECICSMFYASASWLSFNTVNILYSLNDIHIIYIGSNSNSMGIDNSVCQ